MKFKTAVLNHFGKWDSLTLNFSEGWTSIHGDNESGKSTIHNFIIAILFGFKTCQQKELKDDAGGYLIIEYQGKEYRIERYMHQNRKKATVIRLDDHTVVGQDDKILEMTGITQKEARSIYIMDGFFLQQQKITEEEWQRYVLSYAMSGSDQLFKLEQSYDKELRRYFKNRGKQGLIPKTIQEKKDLEDYINRLERDDIKNHPISEQEYEQKIVEKVKKEEELSAIKEYEQIRLSQMNQQTLLLDDKEYIELQSLVNQLKKIESEMNTSQTQSSDYQSAILDYQNLQEKVRCYQQAERRRRIVSQYIPSMQEVQKQNKLKQLIKLLGLLLTISGGITSCIHISVIGFFMIIIGIMLFFFAEELTNYFCSRLGDHNDFEILSEKIGKKITSIEQVENFLSIEKEERDVYKAIQQFSIYFNVFGDTMQEQLHSIKVGIRALKQSDNGSDKESQLIELSNIKELIKKNFPQVENIDSQSIQKLLDKEYKSNQKYVVDKKRMKQLEEIYPQITLWKEDELQSEYQTIVWELQTMQKHRKEQEENAFESLESLRQSLCQVKEQLLQYMIEYEKLSLKLNWVRDIKEKGERNQLPALLQRASQYFRVLTTGKYDQIKFEQNNLKVVRDSGRVDQLQTLSNGTRAQLIIALRFSFITCQKEVSFPIIMDESWAFFDEQRKKQLFKLLHSLSQTHQIITFSHDDLTSFANQTIEI